MAVFEFDARKYAPAMQRDISHQQPAASAPEANNERRLSPLGQWALYYASLGWKVFPCRPGEKAPLPGSCGHKEATDDSAQIHAWWSVEPFANIGLSLEMSGLVAIDVDSYKPECAWPAFIAGRDLPPTLRQTSSRGGEHHIYGVAPGTEVPGKLCQGVDVKHDGYILLHPSTFEGKPYVWATTPETPPAPAPAWLLLPTGGPRAPKEARQRAKLPASDVERMVILQLLHERSNNLSREDWVDLCLALKHTVGEAAYPGWLAFSARYAGGQKPGEAERLWQTAKPDGLLGVGTVLHMLAYRSDELRGSVFFPASDLDGLQVPERVWFWEDRVPKGAVTLLGGDGGTGKSLLVLQLAVAAATDQPFLGREVEGGSVIYFSAEDDKDELHRRLSSITRSKGVPFAALTRLILRSLAGEDALLALDDRLKLTQTALYDELDAKAAEYPDLRLIVIDTLADTYPANENDRVKVRQFMGLLRRLALRHKCAVVLLGHPSLTGMASGQGTSGSTAWNNSARARLYLERVTGNDGQERHPDLRRLTVKKSNYGPVSGELYVQWQVGVFEEVADLEHVGGGHQRHVEEVFLRILREVTTQGRKVNTGGGPNYAPNVFAAHPAARGIPKGAFKNAMQSLLHQGRIRSVEFGPPSKRRHYIEEAIPGTEPANDPLVFGEDVGS